MSLLSMEKYAYDCPLQSLFLQPAEWSRPTRETKWLLSKPVILYRGEPAVRAYDNAIFTQSGREGWG